MSYGIGLHDYDCECPRCKSRREQPQGEPSLGQAVRSYQESKGIPAISPPAQPSAGTAREFAPPGTREKLSAEWMAQDKILDFSNWLVAQVAQLRQEREQLASLLKEVLREVTEYQNSDLSLPLISKVEQALKSSESEVGDESKS